MDLRVIVHPVVHISPQMNTEHDLYNNLARKGGDSLITLFYCPLLGMSCMY
jgi:hypothetical protein